MVSVIWYHILSFNPRSPRGGATIDLVVQDCEQLGFNPRSPRGGATRHAVGAVCQLHQVSIHAPHEGERRSPRRSASPALRCFNPRSPRGGATGRPQKAQGPAPCFNPRSPRGGATRKITQRGISFKFQSTLPTRGSDCWSSCNAAPFTRFQSTLPTRGSDVDDVFWYEPDREFQSTLPTRGSDDQRDKRLQERIDVSIHAPHEGERRPAPSWSGSASRSFNPRSPRGGATSS